MAKRSIFDTLLQAAKDWHNAIPQLSAFTTWPDDLIYHDRPAVQLPVCDLLTSDPGDASALSRPLRDALAPAAPHVEWRHTYTEDQVGRDFLNRFGWFELAGPQGHFITRQTRMTVGYWGPGLHYDWHQHPPEELYSVVSGSGTFLVEGQNNQTLTAEGTRYHASEQRHALRTNTQPILTFVLWRGDGLADDPRMSA